MTYQQYQQPVGTCLRCRRPCYAPNFVAYQNGPMHPECAQASMVQPQKPSGVPIWAIALGAMMFLGGGCVVLLSAMSNSVAAKAPPDVEVDAYDLYEVYRTNEVRADSLYKGKSVGVRGIVGEVQKTMFDDIYVEVRSGRSLDLNSLYCYARGGERENFAALTAGERVKLKTRIEGLTLGHIIGRDCIVMK